MDCRGPIVFLAFDRFQSLDLTGPWEVFAGGGSRAGAPYELILASLDGKPVRSSGGLTMDADLAASEVTEIDTLVVVGGEGTRAAVGDARAVAETRRLGRAARRVTSVCTGAFLLAEAGLLEGRRATTHWQYCSTLAELYPDISVEGDPIYVRDGNTTTSAGVTAGIDLALALLEDDHGHRLALEMARQMVVYARRPGGQAQFSVQLEHQTSADRPLSELQAWVAEHLDRDLSVGSLAGRMNLSERQFARIFSREIGTTPADYVEQLRVEKARHQIEEGESSLERVATTCGFRSAEVMRRVFHRRLGTSPSEYKQRFRMRAA